MSNYLYLPIKNNTNETIEQVIEDYEHETVVTTTHSVSDGAIATPSLNFTDESTTGFSRPSAGAIGLSGAGSEIATLAVSSSAFQSPILIDSTNAEAFLVRLDADAGDIFTVDTSTPLITSQASHIIDLDDTEALLIRKNGDTGDVFTVNTSATNGQVLVPTGSVTVPGLGFQGDTNTGFYSTGDNLLVSLGGVQALNYSGTAFQLNDRDTGNQVYYMSMSNTPQMIIGDNTNTTQGKITFRGSTTSTQLIEFSDGGGIQGEIQYDHTTNNMTFDTSANTRLTIGTSLLTSDVNVQIPADGTVYNSGNDGLKVSNTSGYSALVENAFECVYASATENKYSSALHTFRPDTVLSTTVDYNFKVGDGVSAYTNLLAMDEVSADFNIPITLPTTGGTASNFNYYEEYDATPTVRNELDTLDFYTTSDTISMQVTRVGRLVNVTFDTVSATSLAGPPTSFAYLPGALPARFRPSDQITLYTIGNSGGGARDTETVVIDTSGNISFYLNIDTDFGNGASVLIGGYSVSYSV